MTEIITSSHLIGKVKGQILDQTDWYWVSSSRAHLPCCYAGISGERKLFISI